MATKFTPGPWHVANGVQVRSRRDQIAKVWMMRNGEGNANARLIAAAPDLHEVLEAIELACRMGIPSNEVLSLNSPIRLAARAALAKVRGDDDGR